MLKTAIKLASLSLAACLCLSWEDHPDKCIGPDPHCHDNPNHNENLSPQRDHQGDKSDSAASHEGTCTGVPDRDR